MHTYRPAVRHKSYSRYTFSVGVRPSDSYYDYLGRTHLATHGDDLAVITNSHSAGDLL